LAGGYGARIETTTDSAESDAGWVGESKPRLSWIFVAAPVISNGDIIGVVSVGKATASIETLVRSAKWKILLGTAAGGLALLVGLLVTANWVVAPIEGLANWAREVRDGRPSQNPKAPGRTLRQLRDALVGMRDSLEGREAIERYTRTLAHEIKAPLTAVRSAAELLQEDLPAAERERFIQTVQDGAGRIQRLVDEMLALSRLERDRSAFRLAPVDLRFRSEWRRPYLRDKPFHLNRRRPPFAHARGPQSSAKCTGILCSRRCGCRFIDRGGAKDHHPR